MSLINVIGVLVSLFLLFCLGYKVGEGTDSFDDHEIEGVSLK